MAKDIRIPVQHILQAIGWIESDTQNHDFDSFKSNRPIKQLVERNLEIISEASRQIPAEFKHNHSEIEWRDIAGIGNILRHDYHQVEPVILWSVVKDDLPKLKQCIEKILRELPII